MGNERPIVKTPNGILRKKAIEVPVSSIKSSKIQRLIADMQETLKNTPDGVGLAAPQVGESLRIFIVSEEAEEIDKAEKNGWVRRKEKNILEKNEKPYGEREWKYYVFINPGVKNISKKKQDSSEGCLSIPGKFGFVKRHEKITIEAQDETGKKLTRGASHFFAKVLQHELDHLQGILFIDKAERVIDSQKERL